ncbi:RidA family protein [Streptomyces sp. 5.8]|uniref:RidA family protein n=1 Tax=Streptomyces sp. 5.8 TaxID=3406571 RepID=UPI003BB5BCF4
MHLTGPGHLTGPCADPVPVPVPVAVHGGLTIVSGQVLRHVDACLAAACRGRDGLVSVTACVTDIGDRPEFDCLYGDWLGSRRPAHAVARVRELHYASAVEVHAVAAVA